MNCSAAPKGRVKIITSSSVATPCNITALTNVLCKRSEARVAVQIVVQAGELGYAALALAFAVVHHDRQHRLCRIHQHQSYECKIPTKIRSHSFLLRVAPSTMARRMLLRGSAPSSRRGRNALQPHQLGRCTIWRGAPQDCPATRGATTICQN